MMRLASPISGLTSAHNRADFGTQFALTRHSGAHSAQSRAKQQAGAVKSPIQASQSTDLYRIKPRDISEDNFRPFGQLSGPVDDGKQYDQQDAQLQLDRGTPRFYIMRLPGRGVTFDRITYHSHVTQCLGGLGQQPWYMAVAKPSGSLGAWPQLSDLHAFRIPPGVFIKLHQATWHAGPYFVDSQHMDFYNLELSDTNVTDHNTHVYKGVKVVIELEDC